MKKKKPRHLICWLGTFTSSSARVTGSDVTINLVMVPIGFAKGCGNSFGNKGGESLEPKGACYICGIEGYFASECRNPKENRAFIEGAWSDSEDGDEAQNDATCLMANDSQEVRQGYKTSCAYLVPEKGF
nr:hypothetical protein [Tanacetum cinerariifolium]